jgi:hypothetical protein
LDFLTFERRDQHRINVAYTRATKTTAPYRGSFAHISSALSIRATKCGEGPQLFLLRPLADFYRFIP